MPPSRNTDPSPSPPRGRPFAGWLPRRQRAPRAGVLRDGSPIVPGTTEPAGTGAVDESAWERALHAAASDPRAVPLSAVRLRVDAPGLAGPGRGEELRRLQTVATVSWREILRPADTLAQVGPSEFAVLLPRCDGRAAETIAGRLLQAVPEAARCRAGVATSAHGHAIQLAADAARALAAAAQQRDPLSDPARLAVVHRVRAALGAGHAAGAFDQLAQGTAALLGVPATLVGLIDEGRLHLAGTHGLDALDHPAGEPFDLSLARQAVVGRRPVLVSDTARHGVERSAGAELRLGIAACAHVPLSVDGEIVGAVGALHRRRYEWTDDDTAVLRVAAGRAEHHLGLALHAARAAVPATAS